MNKPTLPSAWPGLVITAPCASCGHLSSFHVTYDNTETDCSGLNKDGTWCRCPRWRKPGPVCGWAPVSHEEPAIIRLRLARPCGHDGSWVDTCPDHLVAHRVGSRAERATTCSTCGAVNLLRVTEEQNIEGGTT